MASDDIDLHERNMLVLLLSRHKNPALEAALRIIGYVPEQQLADTREELRIALSQRQDYRATATNACALLWEALGIIESEEGDYSGWRARCRAFLHTKEAPDA